jgi:hypothetical protein
MAVQSSQSEQAPPAAVEPNRDMIWFLLGGITGAISGNNDLRTVLQRTMIGALLGIVGGCVGARYVGARTGVRLLFSWIAYWACFWAICTFIFIVGLLLVLPTVVYGCEVLRSALEGKGRGMLWVIIGAALAILGAWVVAQFMDGRARDRLLSRSMVNWARFWALFAFTMIVVVPLATEFLAAQKLAFNDNEIDLKTRIEFLVARGPSLIWFEAACGAVLGAIGGLFRACWDRCYVMLRPHVGSS